MVETVAVVVAAVVVEIVVAVVAVVVEERMDYFVEKTEFEVETAIVVAVSVE